MPTTIRLQKIEARMTIAMTIEITALADQSVQHGYFLGLLVNIGDAEDGERHAARPAKLRPSR